MNILFAAPESAWGGFLGIVKQKLPDHRFTATGGFSIESLAGVDVLIPTMCPITRDVLADVDRLKLIQQCGSGLEGVDTAAAAEKNIFVANVPTGMSGNADSVAELGIFLMIGLSRDVCGMATPHIAGSTDLSMQGIVAGVVENIQRLQAGRIPLNCLHP